MDPNRPTPPSDEIDLTQVFRWIGSGFSRLGNSILHGIASIRRVFFDYLFYFIVVISGSVLLSVIYSGFFQKKYYDSSMIISSDYLQKENMENLIQKLNHLTEEKDRTGLMEVLGIDSTLAINVIKFRVTVSETEKESVEMGIVKEQISKAFTEQLKNTPDGADDKKKLAKTILENIEFSSRNNFNISVRVYDPKVIKSLEVTLVNYFRNNNYVRKRIESNEASLMETKKKLIRDSKKLDSLKTVLFENFQNMAHQTREGSNNVILSDKYLTDPLSVFREDLNLNKQIAEIDRELYVKPYFEVIDGLTAYKEPDNIDMPKLIVMSFFISLLGAYVLLGLWKFNLYLAKLEPSEKK